MRRIGALAAIACCAAAWAAPAEACERRPGAKRFVAERNPRAVVVCDRMTGERRVVRRVRAPRRVHSVSVAGPRMVWIEGRSFRTRTLRVRHLLRPGPSRVLDSGALTLLRAADGVTVSWIHGADYRFVDFAPPPLEGGCPARSDFRPVVEQGGLRVSSWGHQLGFASIGVWRVCRVGSGRDRILLTSNGPILGNGTSRRVAGAGNGLVAFVLESVDRYNGCNREHVAALDADTSATVRSGEDDWCGTGAAPPVSARAVVTAAGAVAWVQRDELRAVTASGAVEVLGRGAIADLRAEGDAIRWTNAGTPREARP